MKATGRFAPAMAAAGAVLGALALGRRDRIDFKGKSVVITGASRGLGLVIARELASEGARLALLARTDEDLDAAEQDIASRGAEVIAIPCDVRDQDEVRDAIDEVLSRFGRVDVLMNVAGVIQVGPVAHMEVEDFEEAMDIHMWGPLYTMMAVIPSMRRQGGGRIVNVSSIGGRVAVPHLVPYCASKFALVGLSDGMRAELAKYGIRVTTVCPGLMRTGSPPNAFFKGQHRAEYAWFSIVDALPVASTSAPSAARQIVNACRRGDPHLTITVRAKLIAALNGVLPDAVALIMELFDRVLPAPSDAAGDNRRTGWRSRSDWSPSALSWLSDRATEKYNELRGHRPITEGD